jgi:arsenic resistance protein ArsH
MSSVTVNGTAHREPVPKSLAIPASEDEPEVLKKYRPFLLDAETTATDWIARLELDTITELAQGDLQQTSGSRIKVLVLSGSLRAR